MNICYFKWIQTLGPERIKTNLSATAIGALETHGEGWNEPYDFANFVIYVFDAHIFDVVKIIVGFKVKGLLNFICQFISGYLSLEESPLASQSSIVIFINIGNK